MNPLLLTRVSAIGRIGFGAGLLARPQLLTRTWIGRDAQRPGSQVLARALGVRDLVIGAGALASTGREQQRWLAAALASDATDLLATAATAGLPGAGRVLVSLLAGGGVAIDAGALAGLRRR